jgi:omega-6 fatty acid desaturase (delta-12 desaturase)
MVHAIMGRMHKESEKDQVSPPTDPASPGHSDNLRVGRDLVNATVPYAAENVARSWWHVGSTFILMIAALIGAGMLPWWPARLLLSVLGALLMVRAFITYHDYMHGAILRNSRVAWLLYRLYAAFALTPPRSWRGSHNYHHGHVGKICASSIGAFPVITTKMWREASLAERASYRFQRHPLVVLFGYITIFATTICVIPLLRDPVKYWDSALVLLAHGALISLLWVFGGFDAAFFAMLLPITIASALGSYLFFAQHSFKHMHIIPLDSWSYFQAALESSSYMRLNKLMQWFTGNIGFHHVHHLNVRIPFYRLPETMASLPELQSPVTIALTLRDIVDCFKAALWDEELQRMVSYREASKLA